MIANPAALPSPIELGFPPKFQDWYPDQLRAIDLAVFTRARFCALAMPTGSGKSVTGIATALLHPKVKRAIYLTSTKGLQDQLSSDFQQLGVHDLRGQKNYPCIALDTGGYLGRYRRGSRRSWAGCDEGPCHSGVWCPHAPDPKQPGVRPDCEYYRAVYDARRCDLVSTNYAMWLSTTEYTEGLGPNIDLLILDEAHDADKELEAFLTLEITQDDTRAIGARAPTADDVKVWKDWASHHKGKLTAKIEQWEQQPPQDIEGVRELRALKRVFGKLEQLSKVAVIDWVMELDGKQARFAPLRVADYAEKYLFRGVPHVILMSATMTRKTTQMLGIKPDDLALWECPSRFPIEHRPIMSVSTYPSVRVSTHMSNDDKYFWMNRIDSIIAPRIELNRKGIIHTVSYQRAKDLVTASEHKSWMILHDTYNLKDTIQQFKQSSGPWILVSPSIVTGYDFKDDEARYQIIGKIPFPDMRGVLMSTRKALDKDYGNYLAMMKLIQACGRIVRGPSDWGETFIVDDHFLWFVKTCKALGAPRWFLNAIEYYDTYPEPLFPESN